MSGEERVLGISAFQRDSAAVLAIGGRPVAAARESWFTRRRADPALPRRAARDCLRRAGLRASELDAVVIARKPLLEFERVLVSSLRAFPRSAGGFAREMFLWLGDRLWLRNRAASELGIEFERVRFVEHHRALAIAAFARAPFESAAILTLDEGGEWATALQARGGARGVESLTEQHYPHSLALLALAVCRLLELGPGEEARLEGLAAAGEPRHLDAFAARVKVSADGSSTFADGLLRPGRDGELALDPDLARSIGAHEQDGSVPRELRAHVAASFQALLEERVLAMAQGLRARTSEAALCFNGSLAANRRLVARLAEQGGFDALYVPDEPDEAEAALGAALAGATDSSKAARCEANPFLGAPPLRQADASSNGSGALPDATAVREALRARLARGETVAWVRGARELGSSSLGHRSALRCAAAPDAAKQLLAALGRDEAGNEVELLLPAERADELLDVPRAGRLAAQVGRIALRARPELVRHAPSAVAGDGRVLARPVERAADPELHALLASHAASSGAPLLLHATFVARGAAPVCGETDALETFSRGGLDALVVEDRLYGDRTQGAR